MNLAVSTIKPVDLPTPPQAALKILRACSSADVNNQELGEIASTDPVLSAELLRVVNSPYFGLGGEVSQVSRAINVLGHRALRNMVLCISVRDTIDPKKLPNFDITAFWEDSLRRAAAGKLIASQIGLNGDEAFTACLLQDFGLLVMFYLMPERVDVWPVLLKADPEQRYELETQVFGTRHDQVSQMLAEEWSLPSSFAKAIGDHHQCVQAGNETPGLCEIMHCADWLAALFSADGKSAILHKAYEKLQTFFSIPEAESLEIFNQLPSQVDLAASGLGLHLQDQNDFDEVLREANMRLAEENSSYQELTWQLEKALQERDSLAAALANEMQLAGEIQRSLLPAEMPADFPVYGRNIPALELSGDFFDYFAHSNGRIYFNLGDVSGKGVTASLLMAKTSSLFHCLGKRDFSLADIMEMINTEICETTIRGMFVTMVAGCYDPQSGQLELINAGNPPALIIDSKGGIKKLDATTAPMGILADGSFKPVVFNLQNSHLLMYSDGVTEGYTENSEELGMSGLLQILKKNHQLPPKQQIQAIMEVFAHQVTPQRDDLTLMMVGRAS